MRTFVCHRKRVVFHKLTLKLNMIPKNFFPDGTDKLNKSKNVTKHVLPDGADKLNISGPQAKHWQFFSILLFLSLGDYIVRSFASEYHWDFVQTSARTELDISMFSLSRLREWTSRLSLKSCCRTWSCSEEHTVPRGTTS